MEMDSLETAATFDLPDEQVDLAVTEVEVPR